MRILFVAIVTVGVTSLLGTGAVMAEGAMAASSSGGASSGGPGVGYSGGWSLAPEPSVKRKPTSADTKTATTRATTWRTTGGAWSVPPPAVEGSEPAKGQAVPNAGATAETKDPGPASKTGAAAETKDPRPASSAAVASSPPTAARTALAPKNSGPAREPTAAKTSLPLRSEERKP
jgi:hypothetical protein